MQKFTNDKACKRKEKMTNVFLPSTSEKVQFITQTNGRRNEGAG